MRISVSFFAWQSQCFSNFAGEYKNTANAGKIRKNLAVLTIRQEKEHKPKLLVPDFFRWGGGLPRERGGGQKVRYVPRNPGKPNFLVGYPGIFAGMSWGRPRSWRRKKFVFMFWPLEKSPQITKNTHFRTSSVSPNLSRIIRGYPKSLRKKKFVFDSCPPHQTPLAADTRSLLVMYVASQKNSRSRARPSGPSTRDRRHYSCDIPPEAQYLAQESCDAPLVIPPWPLC